VLAPAAPILVNFFKEMKMSKLRVWGTLVTLVLFAAVAVFPAVVQSLGSNKGSNQAAPREFRNAGVLTADGGDPYPRPPNPIPWPTRSA
ncbi:MAG TPA: hypothetical protein VF748_08740, partial [Candidatus Acidoferrum sp.]